MKREKGNRTKGIGLGRNTAIPYVKPLCVFLSASLHQLCTFLWGIVCTHTAGGDAATLKTDLSIVHLYIPPLEKAGLLTTTHRPGLSEQNLLPLDLKSTPAASKTSSAVK